MKVTRGSSLLLFQAICHHHSQLSWQLTDLFILYIKQVVKQQQKEILMLNKIQNLLIKQNPQLEEKRNLFEYYVSLEFPEKQRKLISWWEEMIESAIRKSGDIQLSPADLEIIFTLHGLKPVPLGKILQHLNQANRIEWEGKQRQNEENAKGWLGSIASLIWKPKNEDVAKNGFKSMISRQQQKIISTSYKKQIQDRIKQIIGKETSQDHTISFDYILSKLKNQIPIAAKSIEGLLADLRNQNWLLMDFVENKKVIMRSNEEKQMKNQQWVEVQKSKFLLKSAIEQFDRKIDRRLKEEDEKLQEAKKCLQMQQSRAKKLLKEVSAMKKVSSEYESRRKLLRQTLDSLEINMINSVTVNLVSECQKIVQKTMVDASEVEALAEKHTEICQQQKEISGQLENMDASQLEDEVDNMMVELEQQIKKQKAARMGAEETLPAVQIFN